MRITRTYRFEASHVLPHHDGKCANLHGHSYRLDVTVAGQLKDEGPASGMLMDFSQVSAVVKRYVVEPLDHSHLNDTVENPTCERLLIWIWSALIERLPDIFSITLWETDTARATLDAQDTETLRQAKSEATI